MVIKKKSTFLDVANLIRVFHIKRCMREFPYGSVVRTQHFHWGGGGVSLIPDHGTMIPQAMLYHQINK